MVSLQRLMPNNQQNESRPQFLRPALRYLPMVYRFVRIRDSRHQAVERRILLRIREAVYLLGVRADYHPCGYLPAPAYRRVSTAHVALRKHGLGKEFRDGRHVIPVSLLGQIRYHLELQRVNDHDLGIGLFDLHLEEPRIPCRLDVAPQIVSPDSEVPDPFSGTSTIPLPSSGAGLSAPVSGLAFRPRMHHELCQVQVNCELFYHASTINYTFLHPSTMTHFLNLIPYLCLRKESCCKEASSRQF